MCGERACDNINATDAISHLLNAADTRRQLDGEERRDGDLATMDDEERRESDGDFDTAGGGSNKGQHVITL
jgi:hypothetical protein